MAKSPGMQIMAEPDQYPPSSADGRPVKQKWPAVVAEIAAILALPLVLYCIQYLDVYVSADGLMISGKPIYICDPRSVYICDFINYWSAPRMALDHHVMSLFDGKLYQHTQELFLNHRISNYHIWSYPPTFLLAILGLGFLPYTWALVVWLCVTLLFYVWAIAANRPAAICLALLLAFSPAAYANLIDGQNGFLTAALLVGGLRLMETRPVLAGILFGFLTYKPQMGVLVPLVLIMRRKWHVILSAIVTFCISAGFSLLVFGIDPWIAYFTKTRPLLHAFLEIDPAIRMNNMMPTVFMSMRILRHSTNVAYAANMASGLFAILAIIYAFRKSVSADLRNSVLMTAMFLFLPYAFDYDMTILAAAIVSFVAAASARLKWYHLPILTFAWYMPELMPVSNNQGWPIAPLVVGALLVLELYFVWVQKDGEVTSPSLRSVTSSSRT